MEVWNVFTRRVGPESNETKKRIVSGKVGFLGVGVPGGKGS